MKHLLENYIKLALKENINLPKTLHIFDFDHTLYNADEKVWLEDIVQLAKDSFKDPNIISILCTARDNRLKKDALNLLRQKDIQFNHYFFNNKSEIDHIYKREVIKDFLSQNPQITRVKFWDDLSDNLESVGDILEDYVSYTPIKINL